MSIELIKQTFAEASQVLSNFMTDETNLKRIETAAEMMVNAVKNGNKIMSCGNGGSMCDAMHFAEELTGKFRDERPSIPAIAVSDPGYLSCTANDYGYNAVFSRFVEGMGQRGDVLLAISTSGNSENVIRAVQAATKKGVKIVALTGKDGGKLAGNVDVEIRVKHFGYADRIQEIHIKVIHTLIQLIEEGTKLTSQPVN